MSVDLHPALDRLSLASDASSPVPSSSSSSGGYNGLQVPGSNNTSDRGVRKQRSQRFTVPTSNNVNGKANRSPVPSLPYQPPPPPVQTQSVGEPYYSFNRNPPMERTPSHDSSPYSPVEAEPYGAAPFTLHPATAYQHQQQQQQQQQPVYSPQYSGSSPSGYMNGYSNSFGPPSHQRDSGPGLQSDWIRPMQHQQPQVQPQQYRHDYTAPQNGYSALMGRTASEDEVIPTAIVIKNIPFQVPKEQLLGVMEDLRLPPPFAFNYHFDNGQFRGLAFANFRHAADAALTVSALNGFDLQGRKLRTEFKKVLKEGEKERIERDKAIKRMRSTQQLTSASMSPSDSLGPPPGWNRREASAPAGFSSSPAPQDDEDYGRPIQGQYSSTFGQREYVPAAPISESTFTQASSNAGPLHSLLHQHHNYPSSPPSDVGTSISARMAKEYSGGSSESSSSGIGKADLDLNDPHSLEIYSRVLLFKDDSLRDELAFARSLSPNQRRTVHLVAQKLGLEHRSVGQAEQRHVVVFKGGAGPPPSFAGPEPPQQHQQQHQQHSYKALRHSASTLGRHPSRDALSSYLAPGDANGPASNLRARKSVSDFRYATNIPPSSPYGYQVQPQPHHHQPASHYHQANSRRSNMNLREGYATVGTASRARPTVQGVFNSFFDQPASQAPAHKNINDARSSTQYYSSDASSSSPSVGLSRAGRADSSHTSDDSGASATVGAHGVTSTGHGLPTRQPRGPAAHDDTKGFSGGAGWRATESSVAE